MSEEVFTQNMDAIEENDALLQFVAWRFGVHLKPFAKLLGKVSRGKNGKKTVHNLRVSCRKLRTVIHNFKPILPENISTVLDGELKKLGRQLGVIRELDTLLSELEKMQEVNMTERAAIGVGVLHDLVAKITKAKRSKVQKAVDSFLQAKSYALLSDFVDQHYQLDQLAGVCHLPEIRNKAKKTIKSNLNKIIAKGDVFELEKPGERFHALRIQMKYLNYSLEDFSCMNFIGLKQQANKINQLQTLMGNIHDRQVWQAQLAEVLAVLEENLGADDEQYSLAISSAHILHLKWEDEIQQSFSDLKLIWKFLKRDQVWENLLLTGFESEE